VPNLDPIWCDTTYNINSCIGRLCKTSNSASVAFVYMFFIEVGKTCNYYPPFSHKISQLPSRFISRMKAITILWKQYLLCTFKMHVLQSFGRRSLHFWWIHLHSPHSPIQSKFLFIKLAKLKAGTW